MFAYFDDKMVNSVMDSFIEKNKLTMMQRIKENTPERPKGRCTQEEWAKMLMKGNTCVYDLLREWATLRVATNYLVSAKEYPCDRGLVMSNADVSFRINQSNSPAYLEAQLKANNLMLDMLELEVVDLYNKELSRIFKEQEDLEEIFSVVEDEMDIESMLAEISDLIDD
ncbi:hypothetical protein [Pseudoalteromonas phage J2-1_QLiu-2017]|nr:hypothetical protein [Pseudoalteromonas phage J2-1_QLiu-2017]